MTTNLRRAALLAAAITLPLAVAGPALADQPGKDQPGKDWMSLEQAASKLAQAGYGDVRKLKADDGHWEAKAVKDGKAVEVEVDPHSGAITEDQDD